MSILSKNPDLLRRIKFYAFGFALGLVAVSMIYKGKGCKMPGTLKLDELTIQELSLSSAGACKAACYGLKKDSLRVILKRGKINYDESGVHNKPYPYYAVEAPVQNKTFKFVLEDHDNTSILLDVSALNKTTVKDTCNCK